MSKHFIRAGTVLRNSSLYHIDQNNKHTDIKVHDIFKDKLVAAFSGPAPFSRLDTELAKLYVNFFNPIIEQGVDEIVAIYYQDAFVCKKFEDEISDSKNRIKIYADGDGFFARDHEINFDFTYSGLSMRNWRWCGIIDDRAAMNAVHEL